MTQAGLLQMVAYGNQNTILKANSIYALELNPYEMKMVIEHNDNKEEPNYFYKLDFGRECDLFKLFGLIIEQSDESDNLSNFDIDIEISKMELEIYSYEIDSNHNKIDGKKNYIGSLPLILGEIKSNSNSILVKFKNLFLNKDTYYSGFSFYHFILKSKIKFKNIHIQSIMRYDDDTIRKIISIGNSIFTKFYYEYATRSKNIMAKNQSGNKISYRCGITDFDEKITGIYFTIPIELVELLESVEIKIGTNTNSISIDVLENKYKKEEKNSVTLYWIGFDLNNLGLLENQIQFNFDLDLTNMEQLEVVNSQISNISIFPMIMNELICIDLVPKLKYSNGKLNTLFSPNEKDSIIKYSNNNVLLVKDIHNKICEKKKSKIELDEELYSNIIKYLGIGN